MVAVTGGRWRTALQLGTAPLWSRRAAERMMRDARDVLCPPGMSRAERFECRRFEMVGMPGWVR